MGCGGRGKRLAVVAIFGSLGEAAFGVDTKLRMPPKRGLSDLGNSGCGSKCRRVCLPEISE